MKLKIVAAAALSLFSGAALADPVSIIAMGSYLMSTAVAANVAGAVALGLTATQWALIGVASSLVGGVMQQRKAKKAAKKQRALANASLEDRTVIALQADPPWRIIYGEATVGGFIADMFHTDDTEAISEKGNVYTKADGLKHMVIVLAAHECQEICDIYLDGESIGELGPNGWATGFQPEHVKAVKKNYNTRYANLTAGTTVLPAIPTGIVSCYTTIGSSGDGGSYDVAVSYTLNGATITVGESANLIYTVETITSSIRVTKHLGTADQEVDTYLNTIKPDRYTVNHRLRGLTYVSVSLRLTDERFQAGPPNLSFKVKGRKVEDTRDSQTRFTRNPALIVRDFLMAPWGAEVASAEVNSTKTSESANICDVRASAAAHNHTGNFTADPATNFIKFTEDRWFSLGDGIRVSTGGTLPAPLATNTTYYIAASEGPRKFKLATSRANAYAGTFIDLSAAGTGDHSATLYDYDTYSCDGSFTTDDNPEQVLEDLIQSMAGSAVYGGQWDIIGGAWSPPVMTLGDSDLSGQVEIVQADASLDDLFNGIRGQYIPSNTGTAVDFEPYQNSVFVTADGKPLWTNRSLPYTNSKVRAKNLSRIHLERSRSAQVIRFPAKLKAWPLQVGDRVTVTSAMYQITSKVYRVAEWSFNITSPVDLVLEEDEAGIWDLADATTADPTPNTDAQNPWFVDQVQGLDAFSGDDHLVIMGDGTILPRVKVVWTFFNDPNVITGGHIDVMWKYGGDEDWNSLPPVSPEMTSTYITEAREGAMIVISVRAVNSKGVTGANNFLAHFVVGKSAPPADATNLVYFLTEAGPRFAWDPCPSPDYGTTVVKTGESWEAGVVRFDAKADGWSWMRPESGTYTVRVKHKDTSGNESLNEAVTTINYNSTSIDNSGISLTPDGTLVGGGGGVLDLGLIDGQVTSGQVDTRGMSIRDIAGDIVWGSDGQIGSVAYITVNGNNVNLSTVAANALVPALNFVGEFDEPPGQVQLGTDWKQNAVYKNTADGKSYVLTGDPLDWVIYLENGLSFTLTVESTNGTTFRPGQNASTVLIGRLFKNGAEVTYETPEGWYRWRRVSAIPQEAPYDDATWNAAHQSGFRQVSVYVDDVYARATFFCDIVSP